MVQREIDGKKYPTSVSSIVSGSYSGFIGTDQEHLETRIGQLENILCNVIEALPPATQEAILNLLSDDLIIVTPD